MFITQRPEQPFPKTLFPADELRPGAQISRFGLKTHAGRLAQDTGHLPFIRCQQGRATFAA
jgi:hypothetical protein